MGKEKQSSSFMKGKQDVAKFVLFSMIGFFIAIVFSVIILFTLFPEQIYYLEQRNLFLWILILFLSIVIVEIPIILIQYYIKIRKERRELEKKLMKRHIGFDETLKILLIGKDSDKKSALTKCYFEGIFNPEEKLTIGVDFYIKTIEIEGIRVKLQLWDFVEEQQFRFLLPTYCLGANGALLFLDITDPQSLINLSHWTGKIYQRAGNIPILVVGNNNVPPEKINKFILNFNLNYIETPFTTREGAADIFYCIASLALKGFIKIENFLSENTKFFPAPKKVEVIRLKKQGKINHSRLSPIVKEIKYLQFKLKKIMSREPLSLRQKILILLDSISQLFIGIAILYWLLSPFFWIGIIILILYATITLVLSRKI